MNTHEKWHTLSQILLSNNEAGRYWNKSKCLISSVYLYAENRQKQPWICVSMSKSFACLISELRLVIQQSEGRRRPSEVRGEHAWTDCLKDWSQNLPTWHFVFTLTQRVRNGCCKCLWVSSVICHLLELSNLKYCCHSTKDQLHLFSGCYMLSKYTPPNSNI